MRIEKSSRGSLFASLGFALIPKDRFFLSAPKNHDRFFFLHTFRSPVFDFNVGVAINESH